MLLDAIIYLLAEGREEHYRAVRQDAFGRFRELKHIQFSHTIHRQDEVKMLAVLHERQRLTSSLRTRDRRRVTEVQFRIFLCNLHVNATIFLQGKTIVVAAYQQDASNALCHQRCIIAMIHVFGVLLLVFVHFLIAYTLFFG